MSNYARALRIARAARNINQTELAESAGLGKSHISLIESGRRNPSLSALGRFARALSLPLEYLTVLAAEPGEASALEYGKAYLALITDP